MALFVTSWGKYREQLLTLIDFTPSIISRGGERRWEADKDLQHTDATGANYPTLSFHHQLDHEQIGGAQYVRMYTC